MESHGLVSFQESALGYLYVAVSNLEILIQNEERTLETLKQRIGNDSVSRVFSEMMASNWERHIKQLKATLTMLKKMVAEEEGRVSILLEHPESEKGCL